MSHIPIAALQPDVVAVKRYVGDGIPIWPVQTRRRPKAKRLATKAAPSSSTSSSHLGHTVMAVAQACHAEDNDDEDISDGSGSDADEGASEENEDSDDPDMTDLLCRGGDMPELVDVVAPPGPGAETTPIASGGGGPSEPARDTVHVAAPRVQPIRGLVGMADCYVALPNGRLSFYANKQLFEARCTVKGHRQCVLSRTAQSKKARSSGSGRPLGLLMSFLSFGSSCSNKEEHWCKETWATWNKAHRREQRRLLLQVPNGPEMMAYERPQRVGEESEPDDIV
eukprot:3803512-Amphidinium_carterae.3